MFWCASYRIIVVNMSARKKPRVSAATHRICPHCDKELNIKTYRAHRRLYFDSQSKSWLIAGKYTPDPKATSLPSTQDEIIDPPGDATDDETNPETDYMDVDVLLECDHQSELDSDHAQCLPKLIICYQTYRHIAISLIHLVTKQTLNLNQVGPYYMYINLKV